MERRRQRQSVILVAAVVIIIIFVIIIGKIIDRYTPTKEVMDLYEYYGLTNDTSAAIVLNDEVIEPQAVIKDGMAYLDYDTVRDLFNERFYWDGYENILLYTTPEDVISASASSKDYYVTKEKKSENYTIVYADTSTAYIAVDYVKKFTDITYQFFSEPNVLVMRTDFAKVKTAAVKKATQVVTEAGSRILF